MSDEYIYHERQEAALCGQHALNNLVQAKVFSAGHLAEIAHQLDQMELIYMSQNNEGGVNSRDYIQRLNEGSGNVDEAGNFSIQVLRAALDQAYNLSLPSIGQEDLFSSSRDITSYPGFICNRSNHWFAIRLIGSEFWNLDSMLEKPETISHFRLAAELEAWKSVGYIVFVVTKDLPPPDRSSGDAKDWWRIEDLKRNAKNVTTKSSTKTKQTDWKVTGIGRRLDGKQLGHETGLTEEELLEHAIQASIMPDVVAEEPSVDAPNVVSIQFRLEGGKRLIRRFTSDQLVWAIFSFCEREMGGQYPLKLRYGFPPKDLSLVKDLTIGEAKLNGESIQVTNR